LVDGGAVPSGSTISGSGSGLLYRSGANAASEVPGSSVVGSTVTFTNATGHCVEFAGQYGVRTYITQDGGITTAGISDYFGAQVNLNGGAYGGGPYIAEGYDGSNWNKFVVASTGLTAGSGSGSGAESMDARLYRSGGSEWTFGNASSGYSNLKAGTITANTNTKIGVVADSGRNGITFQCIDGSSNSSGLIRWLNNEDGTYFPKRDLSFDTGTGALRISNTVESQVSFTLNGGVVFKAVDRTTEAGDEEGDTRRDAVTGRLVYWSVADDDWLDP
jgi:hypothetical protein